MLAQGANRITAQSVSSAGSMVGNTLTLNADRPKVPVLLQGDSALSLTAGILNLLTGSRTLTGRTRPFRYHADYRRAAPGTGCQYPLPRLD